MLDVNEVPKEGTVIYSNGDKYVGSFNSDGTISKGVYSYADGSCYKGSYINYQYEGEALYYINNGLNWQIGLFRKGDLIKGMNINSQGSFIGG